LDIVQKIWAPLGKLFAPPGVPNWLRAWIYVIEQPAYKKKAFIIVLQETHCTTADKLVIPNFLLVGSVLSRNHGLATFVHERLEWSLVDQSPEQSETEWLCVDVAGCKIIAGFRGGQGARAPPPYSCV